MFAGLSKHIDLRLMSRLEFGSGAVAMRYKPRRKPSAQRFTLLQGVLPSWMGAGSGRLAVLHKSRSHTLDESGSIRQPVTQDYRADVALSFKHCRSPASQPRIPAINSSNGVLSPRHFFAYQAHRRVRR